MSINNRLLTLAVILALSTFAVGAFAHGLQHNKIRFDFMKANQIPPAYREKVNPLRITSENLKAGERLYTETCASCHGARGDGKGEMAADLKPPPSMLTGMYARPMVGMGEKGPGAHLMHGVEHHHPGLSHAEAMGGLNIDAYNFWAISEGGEKLGSSMPAFKDILSEQERWQILIYIINGLSTKIGN